MLRRICWLLCVCLLGVLLPSAAQADLEALWIQRLYDPGQMDVGGKEFGQPAFFDEGRVLVVGDSKGVVRAFKVETSEVLWERKLIDAITAPITALDEGTVLVLTGAGSLRALNLSDGKDVWNEPRKSQGGFHSAPLIHGPLVVAQDDANRVLAVTRDGRFAFDVGIRTPEEFSLFGESSPVTDGRFIFVGFTDGTVAALEPAGGKRAWEYLLPSESSKASDAQAGPVLRNGRVYIGSTQAGLVSLNAADGRKLGAMEMKGLYQLVDAPSGEIYAFTWSGKVYRLEPGKDALPRVAWGVRDVGSAGSPGLTRMQIIFCNGDGLVALDRATGKTRSFRKMGGGCVGGVATASGLAAHLVGDGAVMVWKVYADDRG